jgi:hypothetical protein
VKLSLELGVKFFGISLVPKQNIIVWSAIQNCGFEKEKESSTQGF